MSTITLYPSGPPAGIDLGAAGAVVTNIGAGSVDYSDVAEPFIAEGTIAASASATLTGTQFFRATAGSVLSIVEADAGLGSLEEIRASLLAVESGRLKKAPASTAENTITPTGNFAPLKLVGAVGQTNNMIDVVRSDGSAHLSLRDATLAVTKRTADGSIAPEIHLLGQNGGALLGIDIAADEPSSDFAIGCLTEDAGTYDYNGDAFYMSNGRVAGGLLEQAAFGWPAPADAKAASGTARLQAAAPADGAGNVQVGHDIAAFIARGALGQTAPVIASRRWSSASDLWAGFIDGSMEWRDTAAGLVRKLSTDRKMSGYGLATTTALLGHSVSGDAQDRYRITAIGNHEWSPGTGGSFTADCIFRRYNPNVLMLDETALRIVRATGNNVITIQTATDTNNRVAIQASGIINFGAGNAAVDTAYLARHTGAVLRYGDRSTGGKLTADGGIGVGNTVARTTLAAPGTVVRMWEVFDATGTSIGAVPVYATGSFS